MLTNTDAQVRHIYERWHETILRRDIVGLVELYAENGTFESPAVWAFSGNGNGVLHGRAEIASFFETFFHKLDKNVAEWHRNDSLFTDGKVLMWEYPRETPRGDQTDLVESMDLEEGLIVNHRVYWGWIGFKNLLNALGLDQSVTRV